MVYRITGIFRTEESISNSCRSVSEGLTIPTYCPP